ncbi:MAG: protein translocase SEC61 complex subunit gamma [Nanoarchaeota archaeon]|nr:protein translocase SEC61 complex subunit gamma [Nanoarchaeota archaeon]
MASIQEAMIKLKSFFVECVRVVRVTKKPNKETFKMIVKVSAMGMALIGTVGFVISLIATLIGLV